MRPQKSLMEAIGLAGIAAVIVAAMTGKAHAASAPSPVGNPVMLSSRGEAFIKSEEGLAA